MGAVFIVLSFSLFLWYNSIYINPDLRSETMKKLLLIVAVICIISCILSSLFAVFSMMGYFHLHDGSAELYARLHNRMYLGFIAAIIFAISAIICLVIRARI